MSEVKNISVEEKIFSIIDRNLESPKEIRLESRLEDDLDLDSLARLMIINDLEDEFSITIEDSDLPDLKTVADIIEKLKARVLS